MYYGTQPETSYCTKEVQETLRTYSSLQKSTINMQAGYIRFVRLPLETWIMSEQASTSSTYPKITMTEHLTCYSTIKQKFRDIIFAEIMDVFFSKKQKTEETYPFGLKRPVFEKVCGKSRSGENVINKIIHRPHRNPHRMGK